MTKKEILTKEIIKNIEDLDIAGYLKEEIEKFLGYFHSYKLKNIVSNIDFLKDYLVFLDHKNTKQIHQLEHDHIDDIDIGEHNVNYYVSKKGLELVGEHKIKQKIWENDFNLSSVMLGIKGFLLLTVDEFCNATPTRLSINKIMRERELNNC
ncbi:MAG TPA: hypothetical protein VJ892_01670 [Candidatus Absconditabacterales bacterium]|nr:hypothetical protein [Candidatus Absconditabacterales bacterium]